VLDEMGTLPSISCNGPRLDLAQRPVCQRDVEEIAVGFAPAGTRARLAGQEPVWRMLAGVLQGHIGAEPWLDFLRTQLKGSPKSNVRACPQLFDAVLGQPWKQAMRTRPLGFSHNFLPPISQRRNGWRFKSPRFAR